MYAEVGSNDFGSIYQTSSVLKYFIYFTLLSCIPHNHQISLLCPNGDYLSDNQIMCAEVGSDDFGSISQTSSAVKYFIYFSLLSLNPQNHQLSLLRPNRDDLFGKFLLQELLGPQG